MASHGISASICSFFFPDLSADPPAGRFLEADAYRLQNSPFLSAHERHHDCSASSCPLFLVETGFSQGHWSIHQNPAAHVLGPVFRAIFYSGFCSGIVEEMMFRGYLAKLSEQRWGTKHALWLPSILFAFGHFRPGMNLLLFMFQFALYLCIGCLLTILTLQTGSVWNAVLVHSFWNLFVSGTSIVSVSSAPDSSALFTYVISAESPAAGLPQTMLLLFTCAILVFVSCILLLTGKNESA